jgi:hypothetical protein
VKCWTHVSWAEIKIPINVLFAQKALSNVVNQFVYIHVNEHFAFAKIIHPPDRWGISGS